MNQADDVNAIKDRWTGVYGRGAPTYGRVRFFLHWGRRLVELADIPSGAKVLDVATGRGAILFPALEQVGPRGHVTGIDLAEPMVQETASETSRRGLTNVEVGHMDAEHLELPDASFDRVLSGFSLFFFPQIRQAFAEFARVLKPGGTLALITGGSPVTTPGPQDQGPSYWSYRELLRTYPHHSPRLREQEAELREVWQRAQGLAWTERQALGALSWPSRDDLEEVMHEAGLGDIRFVVEEADIVAADEEEWWLWQWSHMPRSELELLEPEILERFKADVFEKLRALKEPDGIHVLGRAMLTLANKPSG